MIMKKKELHPPSPPFATKERIEPKTGLLEEFELTCLKYQDQTAFISFGVKLTYKDLYQKSYQFSQYLRDRLEPDSIMALQLPNLLQYPVSLWGCLMAELKIVNLNPLWTKREMIRILKETEAKGITLLSNKLKDLEEVIEQSKLSLIITTNLGDLLNSPKKQWLNLAYQYKTKNYKKRDLTSDSIIQYSFLKALKKKPAPKVSLESLIQKNKKNKSAKTLDRTLFIQYTGGVTGVTKGVCLSEKNLISNAKQCQTWMNNWLKESNEIALAALPLYHIFALTVNGLVFFFNAYPNVLIADPRNIKSLLRTLKKQKVSVGTGVNTLFKALLSYKKLNSLKTLKVFVSGGMALDPLVKEKWESLTDSILTEGYGLTEASPVVCVNRLDHQKDNSSGYPLPSTKVRIVEKGKELGINQAGELEVKGPQVMKGYYQEAETKKVLTKEGWLKTGDLAKINTRGAIKILGRKKELINVSGFKVYPREIEDFLSKHSKVQEVAVVGRLNKEKEEIVKAYIVPKTNSLTKTEILSYCKENLAPYKIPKEIIFQKSFVKNSLGKPLKRVLK